MKKFVLSLVVLSAFSVPAMAAPAKMTDAQLDAVSGSGFSLASIYIAGINVAPVIQIAAVPQITNAIAIGNGAVSAPVNYSYIIQNFGFLN